MAAITMFAAIEVGSYEIEMKIYEISVKNGIREVDRIAHLINLGRNSYKDKHIDFELIDEVCDVLYDFCKIMKSYQVNNYRVCATSAVREAGNCQNIIDRIAVRTGLKTDVLSNSELRFTYNKAIALRMDNFKSVIEDGTVLVDMGSGSTQLTVFDKGKLITTQNTKLGALRVREVMAGFPVSGNNYRRVLEEYIDNDMDDIRKIFFHDTVIKNVIVTGGYINFMFKNSTVYGNRDNYTIDEFEKQYELLVVSSEEGIEERFQLPREHAGIFIPSSMICKKILDITGARNIWTPDVKLCDGIVAEYAEKSKKVRFNRDFGNDTLNASNIIAKRYMWNEEHIRYVEETSLMIFDAMKKLHGLGKREKLLLQVSAILHECGKYINVSYPGECSFAIIMRTEIIGLSHLERVMVANIVKYNTQDGSFDDFITQGIDRASAMTVIKLAAILRLSNALDKTHKQKCKNLKVVLEEKKLVMTVHTYEDMTIEKGTIDSRGFLFEQAYGVRPVLKVKRN